METNSCLELSSGHDILTPECEPYIVKQYLQTLRSHRIIYQSSSKDLQPMVSAINVCLNSNSPGGKLNGLLALEVLVEDCSSQLFTQAGPNWVQQLICIIKSSNASAPFFTKSCDALSVIITHASDFADVSKAISSSAAALVTSLIDCAKANPSASSHVMTCIRNLQTYYFGAVGPAIKHLEKFVFENLHPWNAVVPQSCLVKNFALLPKAGGGGKEGSVHKEAWDNLALKSVNTLDHLAELMFSVVPSQKSKKKPDQEVLLLDLPKPKESMDLLRKGYFYSAQFNLLSKCLSRLLLSPFNHCKAIRPATFFGLGNKVLRSVPLATLLKSRDLESRILFAVLPDVIASTLKLLTDLVKVSREDLLLFIPDALNLIVGLANELRQSSNPANGSIPFAELRIQLYSFISALCTVLGPNSGVEYIASVLIPLLVSDFLPSKAGVKLAAVSKKNVSKKQQRLATRSDAETREGLQQKSADHMMTSLTITSLNCLGELFKSCGVFLRKSLHKNVQCILIGLCTEVQAEKGIKTSFLNFKSSAARSALYSTLLEVVLGCHPKWPAPTQYALKIFEQGLGRREENDSQVVKVCQKALSVCDLISHPRSATLDLEFPLEPEEILTVKSESMKVHVVYIDSGINNDNCDAFAALQSKQDDDQADMDSADEEDVADQERETNNGTKFSSEPGFELIAGKGSNKRKVETVIEATADNDEEVDYAECEKLMKDVNSFGNKVSITIPDEVANRIIPDQSKRARIQEEDVASESEEGVDLETMLGSFVDKSKDD